MKITVDKCYEAVSEDGMTRVYLNSRRPYSWLLPDSFVRMLMKGSGARYPRSSLSQEVWIEVTAKRISTASVGRNRR